MPILLDTCALLWWSLEPEALSPRARVACAQLEHTMGYVSAISLWEIGIKIKNHKLKIGMPIETFVEKVEQVRNLSILPVDLPTWMESLRLDWSHRDPADRVIVATARLNQYALVTADQEILQFYPSAIWG
jgi:PIN domain nuclease of toxin-antitoxin system